METVVLKSEFTFYVEKGTTHAFLGRRIHRASGEHKVTAALVCSGMRPVWSPRAAAGRRTALIILVQAPQQACSRCALRIGILTEMGSFRHWPGAVLAAFWGPPQGAARCCSARSRRCFGAF